MEYIKTGKMIRKLSFLAITAIMSLGMNAQEINPYVSFVQGQTTSPFDYLTLKIKQYNVVSLGEDHWVKDHMQFLADYLEHVASDTTFHIDALAWESGNSIDQKKSGYVDDVENLSQGSGTTDSSQCS